MAEATAAVWGVWVTKDTTNDLYEPRWCAGFKDTPVTYQAAVEHKNWISRVHPECVYEVREVLPPVDAYDSSTHASDCMCENVCKEEKEKREERCSCGKMTLNSWVRSITDAGNEGTDYVKHTRESCLTRTEREAQKKPVEVHKPGLPHAAASNPLNFGLDPLGYLCAASQEALAKALFFSERCIIHHACEMADYGSGIGVVGPFEVPLAPEILKTLEKAWQLGKAAPEDSIAIEALMYRSAMKTAKDLFLLAGGLKAIGSKKI